MESLRHSDGDSHEARSDAAEQASGEHYARASVGELTARQLDLQRRLVRESLLVRAA